ncbi:hypothetical protein [Maridesulfovibrio bastinii]|jgi:hypothetical protein|uniref:hypothetical protein n=1 Tax=Maridesulfovibrio bastinii TaxID=47157 RepID=UPI000412B309|nr:hypothetical protein [Maridesulfovibrio bastinii]
MATTVMMKHPETGLVKKGFFGFSWTTFFFGGFPALFRGDILTGLIVIVISMCTCGIAGIIWAFFYNKSYTTKLIEKGYQFADSDGVVTMAKSSLGVAS